MKKGVIMKIEREHIVMLSADGEFLKAKKQNINYELGDEIDFFPMHEQKSNLSNIFQMKSVRLKSISLAAAILLILTLIPIQSNDDVYAYMTIDINPSFEMGLDQDLNVISLEAMNQEGEIILNEVSDWNMEHVDEVAEKIITESHENGYLEAGQEVLITTVIDEEEDEQVESTLKADIENLSKTYEKDNVVITAIESDKETREEAKKQGVSTGKLIQERKKAEKETKNQKNKKAEVQENTKKEIEVPGNVNNKVPGNSKKENQDSAKNENKNNKGKAKEEDRNQQQGNNKERNDNNNNKNNKDIKNNNSKNNENYGRNKSDKYNDNLQRKIIEEKKQYKESKKPRE